MTGRWNVPKLILVLFCADLLLGLLYLLTTWLTAEGRSLFGLLPAIDVWMDMDREKSLPTWYSSMKLFVVAVFFGIFAWANRGGKRAWVLLLPPALFLGLSIDEAIEFHERVGFMIDPLLLSEGREGTSLKNTGIITFTVGPILLAVLVVIFLSLRPYLRGARGFLKKAIIGSVVFMLAAALGDHFTNLVSPDDVWGSFLQVLIEEEGEMIGITLIAWAAWELLSTSGIRLRVEPDAASGSP